jgi:hypothetical protein
VFVIEGHTTFRWTLGSNSNADDIAVYSANRIRIRIRIRIVTARCIIVTTTTATTFGYRIRRASGRRGNRVQDGG